MRRFAAGRQGTCTWAAIKAAEHARQSLARKTGTHDRGSRSERCFMFLKNVADGRQSLINIDRARE